MTEELVDTDILIDVQRKFVPAVAWFSTLVNLPSVPCFVAMELIESARNKTELQKGIAQIAPMTVIHSTEADSVRALELFANYHLSSGLGLIDTLIAACALGRSATLLTTNTKHYGVIPGLKLVQPYKKQ